MARSSGNRHRWHRRRLAIGLASLVGAAITIGLAGVWLYRNRVALFIVPSRWRLVQSHWSALIDNGRTASDSQAQPPDDLSAVQSETLEVLKLQLPDHPLGRPVEFSMWTDSTHDDVAVVRVQSLSSLPQRPRYYDVVLDGKGRVLGDPFRVPYIRDRQYLEPSPGHSELRDTALVAGLLEVQFDHEGVVPLGFVDICSESDVPAVAVSRVSNPNTRLWLRRDPGRPLDDVRTLLLSRRRNSILRALFELQWANIDDLSRVVEFLDHPDPEIRARAVALLPESPNHIDRVLPLREDPVLRVRLAAHFAALHAARLEAARASYLHLLRTERPRLFRQEFDRRRLRSPAVASALIAQLASWKAQDGMEVLTDIVAHLEDLESEDIVPNVGLLLRIWNEAPSTVTSLDRIDEDQARSASVLGLLVRAQDSKADELIDELNPVVLGFPTFERYGLDLESAWGESPIGGATFVLPVEGLLRRTVPVDRFIAVFRTLSKDPHATEPNRQLSKLVLFRWGIPGFLSGLELTMEGDDLLAASIVFRQLLERGPILFDDRLVFALQRVAESTEPVSLDVLRARQDPMQETILVDRPLAANLVLVRWNVSGADERFLRHLRHHARDWLSDELSEVYLPNRFERDLIKLSRTNPVRYETDVYRFLSRWNFLWRQEL